MFSVEVKMHRFFLFTLLIFASLLSACSPAILHKTGPEVRIKNKDDLLAANYMARFLMPQKERIQLVSSLQNLKPPTTGLSAEMSTGIGAGGALALGKNPLTGSGMHTATSIELGLMVGGAILNYLGPDGSLKRVSKIFLPETVAGQTITSPDQAFEVARAYTIGRIKEAASREGRTAVCILNCEYGSPVFMLIKEGMTGRETYAHMGKASSGTEYYDPPALYVATALGSMAPAPEDVLRDKFLEFSPKWESEHPNSWQILLGGDIPRTANQEIQTIDHQNFGIIFSGIHYSAQKNPLARRVMSHITGGPGYILGGTKVNSLDQQFSMKGKIFAFNTTNSRFFMRHEVAPDSFNHNQYSNNQ